MAPPGVARGDEGCDERGESSQTGAANVMNLARPPSARLKKLAVRSLSVSCFSCPRMLPPGGGARDAQRPSRAHRRVAHATGRTSRARPPRSSSPRLARDSRESATEGPVSSRRSRHDAAPRGVGHLAARAARDVRRQPELQKRAEHIEVRRARARVPATEHAPPRRETRRRPRARARPRARPRPRPLAFFHPPRERDPLPHPPRPPAGSPAPLRPSPDRVTP